ncbi:hypothetical protein MMC26_002066 [Xylographa opegraphella]|nr:hypothetical protein [Xylographa opegraphella]
MSTRKSTFIKQGAYLADVESCASFGSFDLNGAIDRPFPVPKYDPQSSLDIPDTACNKSKIRTESSSIRASRPKVLHSVSRNSINWYQGNQTKATGQLGIVGTDKRRSRLSITPSVFQIGTELLSVEQNKELGRLKDDTSEVLETPLKGLDEYTEPPNGGAMAWAHTVAGHLVVFNAQGLNMSYGIFQAYYQNVMLPANSPAQIAWIGSFQIFLLFFMSIIVSPLLDKGYFRLCFNGGSAILVMSVVMTSFCTQWWQLLVIQGLLTGIGMGLAFGSGVIILMSYFSKRIGIATGIAAAGSSTGIYGGFLGKKQVVLTILGGIFFPLIAEKLIFKIGYRWTVRVMALVVFLTLIPANIIARERPGHKRRGKITMDWSAFHDIPYLLMMAGMFFSFLGIYFGFYYIATFGEAILLLSPSDATSLLIAMNAANLPGRFVPALISDACIGPLNTIVPATFLAAMQIFIWIGSTTHNSLLVIACLYGFSAAGLQSLYSATIFSFAPDATKAGIRMAMVFVVIGVACLTGAPIGGALIVSDRGSYFYAQVFSGCSILLGATLLLVARVVKSGWLPQRV